MFFIQSRKTQPSPSLHYWLPWIVAATPGYTCFLVAISCKTVSKASHAAKTWSKHSTKKILTVWADARLLTLTTEARQTVWVLGRTHLNLPNPSNLFLLQPEPLIHAAWPLEQTFRTVGWIQLEIMRTNELYIWHKHKSIHWVKDCVSSCIFTLLWPKAMNCFIRNVK